MIDILNKIDLSNKHKNTHIYTVQVFSPSINDFVSWDGMQYDSIGKLASEIIKFLINANPDKEYDEVLDIYNSLIKKEEIVVYDVDLQMLNINRVEVESLIL